jgi:hypothetical protein
MAAGKSKSSKHSQSQRFIEATREAECSEDEAVFDDNLKRIAKAKQKPIKPEEENDPNDR